ncbi:hypothetical protein QNH46_09115 [Paenibacillus woosongensis]|uniref:Uncharacterized protein n=1 Tax=Paenibacillus woosongensis TaxID=307580 RepID=A0AA95L2M3_9BACL|nr:hypothetical protein [Paenibacillus woosongensis]WHX50786.1 hypothetical protein QNH46_09115 [Paenibacillus woosongensis]
MFYMLCGITVQNHYLDVQGKVVGKQQNRLVIESNIIEDANGADRYMNNQAITWYSNNVNSKYTGRIAEVNKEEGGAKLTVVTETLPMDILDHLMEENVNLIINQGESDLFTLIFK